MKEALLYQKLDDGKVRCNLCEHRCIIHPGKSGVCHFRENERGILYTRNYGKAVAKQIDPVEKKPLYHFYPGSEAYSVATEGCNFRCRFCQNWAISQTYPSPEPGRITSPGQIVRSAKRSGCKSIAYTYTEPTVYFEYTLETARLAHEEGIRNVYVSNGYMSSEMLDMIGPWLDAVNVDLKTFRDETYLRITGGHLQPVLDNLKKIRAMGIWLEVTSLIVPGMNDDPAEIKDMAAFIASDLGVDVPWHISRFFPSNQMQMLPPTPLKTLQMARITGHLAGLHYVYPGNTPGLGESNTLCPGCDYPVIRRLDFQTIFNHLRNGRCPNCGRKIAGVFEFNDFPWN